MDTTLFDRLTRVLTAALSRQSVLRGLARAGFSLAALRLPDAVLAKKKHKHNNNKLKLKRNEFGCVNVGGNCLGNDANCCSGICEGKKPKKGKKDKSHCVAHDPSDCQVGHLPCHTPSDEVDCTTTSGAAGLCYTTTGNGAFCGAVGGVCVTCSTDEECQPLCGAGAACMRCNDCESPTVQTAYIGISGGCLPP